FLTVHPSASGLAGDLVQAGGNGPVAGPAPAVSVDTGRRQVQVSVPHAAWNPTGQVVRLAMGVGLWDAASGRYLLPQASQDAAHPGGAGTAANPPAFFNVAFRGNGQEAMPAATDPANQTTRPAWWRDREQASALATGDITEFHASVDFAKLAARATDDSGVPAAGPLDRILASHFEPAQGADYSVTCFPGS